MEHVGQGPQEHAASPLDVAEDRAFFRLLGQPGAIAGFPGRPKSSKLILVSGCLNMRDLQKDSSELSGVRGLGMTAAPREALPLNMDQASLHGNIGPEFAKDPHHSRIAINGEAARAQATLPELLQESRELRLRALRDTIAASNEPMRFGVHHGNKASWPAQKSPVQDQMLVLSRVQSRLRGRLRQVIADHLMESPWAMATLARQLPDHIAFNKPTPEPFPLSSALGCFITPPKRAPAPDTKPSLSSINVVAIALQDPRTLRAVFFSSRDQSLNQFNDYALILRLTRSYNERPKAHIFDYYAHSERSEE